MCIVRGLLLLRLTPRVMPATRGVGAPETSMPEYVHGPGSDEPMVPLGRGRAR
jgi:hypothetical protein